MDPPVETTSSEMAKLLSEMTQGMDDLRDKVQPLLAKVEEGGYPTKDGISYLEAKHMLLLSYCQHLVFVVLMKAEGKALPGHPVLERLAEIRLFLEKIRPIDKKLNYQIQKLLKQASAPENAQTVIADKDDLRYKPNPDMLVSKIDEDAEEHGGVYKPPKIAPTTMEGDESAKDRRHRLRLEKKNQERGARSTFIRDLQNDLEGRPEEIYESVGAESKEFRRQIEKLEDRERREEEMFTRVPLSREERKKLKHLKHARNGMRGLMDDFKDEVGGLFDMEAEDNSRKQAPRERPRKTSRALRVKKPKGKFKRKRK